VLCAVYRLSRSSKKQQNESQCCCLSPAVAVRWMTSSCKHASSQLSPPQHTRSGVWNSEFCIYHFHTALRRNSLASAPFYGTFWKLLKAGISFFMSAHMSVCLHGATRLPMKFDIWTFFENLWRNFQFNLLKPNVNYSGRTAPLTSKVAFYIFIQQI